MFEPAACDHLRLLDTPFVDGQALIELKAVLETALRADGTIPWLLQEVLMPRSRRRLGVSQPTLFHPPPPRPQFQMLP
jgi:hypothetical protein